MAGVGEDVVELVNSFTGTKKKSSIQYQLKTKLHNNPFLRHVRTLHTINL